MENGEHALIVYDDLSQAGRGVSPVVAAAAPPAGPRGVSRRRVLSATAACSNAPPSSPTSLAPARSRRCRSSRRKAGEVSAYIPTNVISITDGQIYLSTDLFFGRAASHERRHLGVPRRRRRPDQGDEEGRRRAAARPRRVPRARSVRQIRHRARRRSKAQLDRGYRLVELLQAAAEQPDARRGAGRRGLRRHQGLPRQLARRRRSSLRRRTARPHAHNTRLAACWYAQRCKGRRARRAGRRDRRVQGAFRRRQRGRHASPTQQPPTQPNSAKPQATRPWRRNKRWLAVRSAFFGDGFVPSRQRRRSHAPWS